VFGVGRSTKASAAPTFASTSARSLAVDGGVQHRELPIAELARRKPAVAATVWRVMVYVSWF